MKPVVVASLVYLSVSAPRLAAPQGPPLTLRQVDSSAKARLARRRDVMLMAPKCQVPEPFDTTSWVDALPAEAGVHVRLPKEFMRDSQFASYHGGVKWTAAARMFVLENGWWYPELAYRPGAGSCRVRVSSGVWVVDQSTDTAGYNWSAIPADTEWGPSLRVGAHARRPEDLRLAWTVLATLRWTR